MKRGKYICDTLKRIRKQIADANAIVYEPRECKHEGDCLGTCPACEAEVRYLKSELDTRRRLGKAVALVGISAGLVGLAGCGSHKVKGEEPMLAGIPVMPPEVHIPEPPKPACDTLKPVATSEDGEIFGDVDETMPQFRGGDKALVEFLKENVRFPEGYEGCVQGRVIVSFLVEKDGSISDAKVLKSLDPPLDKEALRVVGLMPKWAPATRGGQRVPVRYTLPVTFRLE